MIQINLLPDIKVVYLKVRRLRMIVFLVSLFIITICTITLMLLGVTTLVQQKNDILSHVEKINTYVDEFNQVNGREVRKYIAIQDKFESLTELNTKKIDANKVWSNGLFGGGQDSFLPVRYLDSIELFDFNFKTGEFTVSGSVEESGEDVNFRDYFNFAYYEVYQGEDGDEDNDDNWVCPPALADQSSLGRSPNWTYCKMFNNVEVNSEFQPELKAQKKITATGFFTIEVPNSGQNLFSEDTKMRVKVPPGCTDIGCISRPDLDEEEPQDFVNNNAGAPAEEAN